MSDVKARKMRDEAYKLTLSEKQILYYRTHPVQAARDLLGIELIWLQRITLRAIFFCRFPLLNEGRGVGKSFILALAACLLAMLYPRTKIGIIAPVFRQANYVFDHIDEIYHGSEFLRAATTKASARGAAQSLLRFHNGSFIEALPLGDGNKIRGRRYHIVGLDEYAQIDESIIKLVIRPMLNIKRGNRDNKLIVASTSFYRWNHYWMLYLFYIKKMMEGNTDYRVIEFDYTDVQNTPNSPYRIDDEIIEMQKSDMTAEEFAMENLCTVGESKIKTLDGMRRAEKINVDDFVLTHKLNWKKVTKVFKRYYEGELVCIKFYGRHSYIKVTPEHPIYNYLTDSWILAKDIDTNFFGYQVHYGYNKHPMGKVIPIKEVKREQYSGYVYNFEVEDDNSYLINKIAVHNCLFPAESVGFISAKLIDQCTPKVDLIEPEFQQQGVESVYVMGVDAARQSGGDNFALVLLKLGSDAKKIVYVETLNGRTFQEMANTIRSVLESFNVVRIHIGAGGGGLTIKDLLAETWYNSKREKMLPILDMEDKMHENKDGVHIIKMINESARKNNELYMNLKAEMQHKRILFPIDVKTSDREAKRIQEVYNEILSLKRELMVLEAQPSGAYHKFIVPSKYKKDRATALVLALDGGLDLNRIDKTDDFQELPIGIWV